MLERKKYQPIFHPIVGLCYALGLLTLTMFTVNPLIRFLSLISGLIFYWLLYGTVQGLRQLRIGLLIIGVSALSNFIFMSHGSTKLWQANIQLFSRWFRLAFTTEAFFYGLSFGMVLVSLFIWFQCFSMLLPTENLVYLIARPLPKIALVLNLVLSFIPSYLRRLEELRATQRSLGLPRHQTWRERLTFQQQILVALFSWSLREGLVTADSMSARGYGSGSRAHYAKHHFRFSDGGALMALLFLGGLMFSFSHEGAYAFYYYPRLRWVHQTWSSYLPVAGFFFLPQILMGREALKWHYYQSKI